MNRYIVILFSTLLIFLTSCATTKREYPTSSYQCQKTGEIFEISNSIDEGNLICPDKTCGGKLVKVASYRRYGSGLNTRYGYSDPWSVGYSGPYVNRRSFFGMGFHSGHHHHHYYHDDKRSKSGSKKSSGPFSKNIPTSGNNSSGPSTNSKSFSKNIPGSSSKPSSSPSPGRPSSSSSSSKNFSRSIPSSSSSSSRSSGGSKSFSKSIPSKSSD